MIFKLSATSRYLFWVRWFVFSCGYIFWKPVISMCRRGARWISPPKHRKMCNTSLTQPCHRSHIYIYSHIQIPYNYSQISHIFPYFGYQFHPRRAWLECATKKTMGKMTILCPGVTWEKQQLSRSHHPRCSTCDFNGWSDDRMKVLQFVMIIHYDFNMQRAMAPLWFP